MLASIIYSPSPVYAITIEKYRCLGDRHIHTFTHRHMGILKA